MNDRTRYAAVLILGAVILVVIIGNVLAALATVELPEATNYLATVSVGALAGIIIPKDGAES